MELEKKWKSLAEKVYDYAVRSLGEPETETEKEYYQEFFKLTYNVSMKKWICCGDLDCMIDVYAESDTMTDALEQAFEQLEKNLKIQK